MSDNESSGSSIPESNKNIPPVVETPVTQQEEQDPTVETPVVSRKLEYVEKQSLLLFDRFKTLHGLGLECRQILSHAALLQETRLPGRKKNPYKDAKKIVKQNVGSDLNSEQTEVLAAILALSQKKIKPKSLKNDNLSPIQIRESLTLAAILRVAVGLDRSNTQQTEISHTEVSQTGIWIVVEGPEALADSATAQQAARLWEKIGYPSIKVMESGTAADEFIPFPEPIEKPDVLPEDTLAQAARKVMSYQFAEMLRHEEGTRLGEDIEYLHHMRVATRRLRAAFGVFQPGFEPGTLKPYLQGLRSTGKNLGRVRDLDVFIFKTRTYCDSLPEEQTCVLETLNQELNEQREQARDEMLVYLDSSKYFNFKRKFNTFLKTPGIGIIEFDPDDPEPLLVKQLVPVLIYDRFADLQAYDQVVPEASIELLHSLRIEIKRFRYTLEYFKEVLGPEAKTVINQLKGLQDHLGDLNDAQVSIQKIKKAKSKLQELDDSENEPIEEFSTFRKTELATLLESFPQVWQDFNSPELRKNIAAAISVL